MPGTPGHYRRLPVMCDHHYCGVLAQCKKTRSVGVRSMVRHGLGELEPYAFLGALLERRGNVDSKAEHVACGHPMQQTSCRTTAASSSGNGESQYAVRPTLSSEWPGGQDAILHTLNHGPTNSGVSATMFG